MSGRILALSDVFDAITSRRHYRSRMPFDKVLQILQRDAGKHFDPECVDAFFELTLSDISEILMIERVVGSKRLFDDNDSGIPLYKAIGQTTLREYFDLMKREEKSKGEIEVYRAFSNFYHAGQGLDL